VVITIIALLIAILLPSIRKAREVAQAVTCQSNLRQIGIVFQYYIDENEQNLPPLAMVSTFPFPANEGGRWYTNLLVNAGYIPAEWANEDWGSTAFGFGAWACPSVESDSQFAWSGGYGVNETRLMRFSYLGGAPNLNELKRPSDLLLIADCHALDFGNWVTWIAMWDPIDFDWNVGFQQAAPRHSGNANITFVDGHAEAVHFDLVEANHGNMFNE
jgi:prepilin-type processing-associated H-X9-DG protein